MKKYALIAAIVIVLGAVGGVFVYRAGNKEVDAHVYTIETVDEFIQKTQNGEAATLIIESDMNGNEAGPEQKILFNGTDYTLICGLETGNYQCFYKASGTWPNGGAEFTRYVLADQRYTFEEITQSMISAASKDHLAYVVVYISNEPNVTEEPYSH